MSHTRHPATHRCKLRFAEVASQISSFTSQILVSDRCHGGVAKAAMHIQYKMAMLDACKCLAQCAISIHVTLIARLINL